jgi:transposase
MNFRWFAGIDWAAEKYDVWVLDADGKKIAKRIIQHNGSAIAELLDGLEELAGGNPEAMAIAIETPWGAMVESLVERKFAVFAINPKQLDRFRDRYTVAGAKDDSRDALVLGDSLRTDEACFHRVELDSAQMLRLRELSRLQEELQIQENRLSNQLWEQLHRYYPQMLALSPGANEPWLWDLIEMAPLPSQAGQLKLVAVKRLLRSYRIRRVNAEEVVEILKARPLQLAPGAREAASEHVMVLLPLLRSVHEQHERVGKRVKGILKELSVSTSSEDETTQKHSDAAILLSLPGVGQCVGATMLAEASQPLMERDYHALRCYTGCAPVTRQSGNRRVVMMRRACSERLRNALYYWSMGSLQDAWARAYYHRQRAGGNSHAGALRSLGDRWLGVLIAMLKSGTLYDPAQRGQPAQAS